MDSTPRHVWVEKGGDSKRMESFEGKSSTFTNPKHIIYIKEVFFLYLILSIKRHNNNSLLLDVLKVFYALDFDVLWCCGRLSFAKRRESSSRVLHYYVVVRCVCDWNSRPILLCVQLEEGKTLSKKKVSFERAYKERSTKEHPTQKPSEHSIIGRKKGEHTQNRPKECCSRTKKKKRYTNKRPTTCAAYSPPIS